MEEYVSAAWAQLVSQRENLLSGWEKDIAQGNALERLTRSTDERADRKVS